MRIDLKQFSIDPMPELKKFFFDRHIQDTKIKNWLGDEVYLMAVGRWLSGNKQIPDKYKSQMDNLKQSIIEWEKEHGTIFNHGHVLTDNISVTKRNGPPTPKKKTSPPTLKNKQIRDHTYIN
jgi:hypothetical protein